MWRLLLHCVANCCPKYFVQHSREGRYANHRSGFIYLCTVIYLTASSYTATKANVYAARTRNIDPNILFWTRRRRKWLDADKYWPLWENVPRIMQHKVIGWIMLYWNGCKIKRPWHSIRYRNFPKVLRKIIKRLSGNNRFPNRDLKQETPERES
jgi:hypothetical protein